MMTKHVPILAEWREDFLLYQYALSRRLGFLLSCVVLVLLPVFATLEATLLSHHNDELVWQHNSLRLPTAVLAITFLVLYLNKVKGCWTYPLLLALNLSVVGMMASMFTLHYSQQEEHFLYINQGLTMAIVAMATATVYGARDLAIVYGLPLLAVVSFLAASGYGLPDNVTPLIYIPLAMGIGIVIATMLYKEHRRSFIASQQLAHNALTDALTGLPNRRAMQAQLQAEWSRAERKGPCFAVLMADLDRFKAVNDQHGHEVGDEVLIILASRFNANLRSGDRVARWGGEEFLMLIPDANEESALAVAEKIRRAVAEPAFATSAGNLAITLSLGVALHRRAERIDDVISRADKALYRAKQEGRNRAELAKD
ncbi:GGDEF domain-containing protein [Halovibrio sp. HP20-50]|uniref:GGDEF domain-containing protein n=1 Tax=Halovibrio sp. HP20-59 TaxID=3080275 RepID=UPI00294B82D4|nr:GGDEF domain-containing protein [Halovibrio sp. HP20-59]MEA2117296.1 GGDEF domain-containing protein [Halovibrio sp. HP20-59]